MKYMMVKSSPPRAPAAVVDLPAKPGHSRSHGTIYRADRPPAVATEGEIEEWLRDTPASETAGVLIANLIAEVAELGLPSRMARSLESRLTTAIALLASPEPSAPNQAIEQMQSFARRVAAMSGSRISMEDAAALLDRATHIIQRI